MNILLLGANDRACYSLAKTYARQGWSVTVMHDDSHAIASSRFVQKFIRISHSFTHAVEEASQQIEHYLKENAFDCLIPVNDIAVALCIKNFQPWSLYTKVLNINEPDIEKYSVNKYELLELAKSLNFPVPATRLVSNVEEIAEAVEASAYPVIAKPVQSRKLIGDDIYNYTVKKISEKNRLSNFLREKVPTVPVMLQEVLEEGYGVGFNFLAKDGKILQSYAHQRINEAWGGGQSSYRKSIPTDTYDLYKYSEALISKIGWSGIAMMEYRVVKGLPFIMEINGRPWGSIEVGTFGGVDLALGLIKVFVENEKVINTASREVYVRNLYNDFIWILKSRSPAMILKWFASLKTIFKSNHYNEDSVLTDPAYRIRYISEQVFYKTGKALVVAGRKIFWPTRISVIKPGMITASSRVAFICKGNINRSAFAEYYFLSKYKGKAAAVESFGVVHEEQRMAPLEALTAAKHFGVDLAEHRSNHIKPTMATEFDYFLIMDSQNYRDMIAMNIPAEKLFLLHTGGIKDPYGKDQHTFNAVFEKIAKAIDRL
ncbi:MAG: hypothetical protein QM687_00645 [Ferruginibacter sp.]